MKKNTLPKSIVIPLRHHLVILGAGLVACAAPARNADSRPLRASFAGYDVEVLVDGTPAPSFRHDGESYVLGHAGDRYVIRVLNHTGRRVEAVVTVDGRDVVDGKPGDFRNKRGYLVPAWGQIDIDGWRLSESRAAAFRFSSVADSYAARTGSAREVGVIGVAVFPERSYQARPLPAPPPCCFGETEPGLGDARASGSAGAPTPAAPASVRPAPAPAASDAVRRGATAKRAADAAPARHERPGLGTEFGEAVSSPIQEVEFVRANPVQPATVLGVRYNDRDGLLAMGVNVDATYPGPDESELRRTADPFPLSRRGYALPPAGWQR